LYISRRFTAPVKTMMEASQRIAQGDYSKRVLANEKNTADELDQLAQSYNQMAEKLQKIEEMRRQLLADVSHELRTPLTAIKGSMEGLVDGVLPANRETYESIYHEADRLQRLVEDLHELSRVQSTGLVLHMKDININALVRTAQKRLQAAFNNKKIHLSTHIDKNIPKIKADEDRITQVLINLLSNALQFTPPSGAVVIAVRKEKNELVTSVQDDGVGIRASDLPHIFERFYRADKSRSRAEGGGSGIGLTIAQSLVHAHGGRIWAESAGEGKGSIFYFSLPIKSNH
jgi:signal transduction histidine kinase